MHALLLECIMEQTAVTQAELVSVDGERMKKFDVKAEGNAHALGKRISAATLQVWEHLMLEQWALNMSMCRQFAASPCCLHAYSPPCLSIIYVLLPIL